MVVSFPHGTSCSTCTASVTHGPAKQNEPTKNDQSWGLTIAHLWWLTMGFELNSMKISQEHPSYANFPHGNRVVLICFKREPNRWSPTSQGSGGNPSRKGHHEPSADHYWSLQRCLNHRQPSLISHWSNIMINDGCWWLIVMVKLHRWIANHEFIYAAFYPTEPQFQFPAWASVRWIRKRHGHYIDISLFIHIMLITPYMAITTQFVYP